MCLNCVIIQTQFVERYFIHLKLDAVADLDRMRKYDATMILDGMETYLRSEPRKESRSRVKKLRGNPPADYRLRIRDWRIFYRVIGKTIDVLRIFHKDDTHAYYEKEG